MDALTPYFKMIAVVSGSMAILLSLVLGAKWFRKFTKDLDNKTKMFDNE